MKKIAALLVTTCLALAGAAPASAATPPTYGSALDCLFGGLTNGPDSDPDMVAALFLVFDAAALEAAGDYEGAFQLLADAANAPTPCSGDVLDSARELAAYTLDLWAEAGASAKDLQKADRHLARGDKHLSKGKTDETLQAYGKALEDAVEGLAEG